MPDPARKPGETHERWVERVIREAQEEGAFEHLAGAGKPLPLTGVLDEAWWIKEKLRREKLSDLPEAIAIRLEAEQVLAEVARERDERQARERLEELDAKIRRINRTTISGPPTTLAPLDVEEILARWRAARER
jgi:DnaJ homologue, subfamily C, member 28, conserved domain